MKRVVAVAAVAGLLGLLTAAAAAAPARAGADDVDVWVGVGAPASAPGAVVKVRVSWGNHGPKAAGTVVLTYSPPVGATLAGALPRGWSKTLLGDAVWSATSLAADGAGGGRSASLPVRIGPAAAAGTKLTGGAGVIGLGALQAHTDRVPGNDRAASVISVAAAPAPSPTPSPKPSPSPSARPTPRPTPSPTPSARPTASPTPTPTPSPRHSPARSPRPTPAGPTTAPGGTGGPTAVAGEEAAATAAPVPHGGGWPDVDPLAAVAVPFGAVGIGCVLWFRRRLGD